MNGLMEIYGLSGGYEKGVNIIEDINLAISAREVLGVIGLNGSGKSTFGKALLNMIPYRSGNLYFEGQSINGKSTCELAQIGITMMHQGGTVFPNLTVRENLRIAFGNNPDIEYVRQLEDIIPLLSQKDKSTFGKMADKLSGGQRLELALAMTLARKPRLIILDEPSAGLSPSSVEATYTVLSQARKCFGQSIVLIEQNISRAVSFCDHCVMFESGRIIYQSTNDGHSLETIERLMFKQ